MEMESVVYLGIVMTFKEYRQRCHSWDRQGKISLCRAQAYLGIKQYQIKSKTPHLQFQREGNFTLRM